MNSPNNYDLVSYILHVFYLSAITAMRSAHHKIEALTAVGKTDRL